MTKKHQHNYIPEGSVLKCSCGHFLTPGDAAAKINLLESVIYQSEDDIDKMLRKIADYLVRFAD